jgi:prevent-host-death family protein
MIGTLEAKTHFSALLDRVERGEEIVITRHGRPVAKLVPAATDMAEVVAKIREVASRNTLGGLDWRELRDEGRR